MFDEGQRLICLVSPPENAARRPQLNRAGWHRQVMSSQPVVPFLALSAWRSQGSVCRGPELQFFNATLVVEVENVLVLEPPLSVDLPDMRFESEKWHFI